MEGISSQHVHQMDGVVLVAGGVDVRICHFVEYVQVSGNFTDLLLVDF